jgi:hypothetical protein
VKRLFQVWEDDDGDGVVGITLCSAGSSGEASRQLLRPNAKLLATFEAESHFEAMTLRNQMMWWEPYKAMPGFEAEDKEPFPDAG